MAIWSGFIVPIIKVVFILGIFGTIAYFIIKAFRNVWDKSIKFFFKYKIRGKPYPEKTIEWILNCIENGVGWSEARKIMTIKMYNKKQVYSQDKINETLYIYDMVVNQLNKEKGGVKNNGRGEIKGSNSENESKETELPTI